MKRKLSILFFLAFSFSLSIMGQGNYGQELIDLLTEGNYFEARDFKQLYGDSLPENGFVDIYYKYKTSQFTNKSDSAGFYLYQLITNHEDILRQAKSHFYGELLEIYSKEQQFDKAVALCDEIIAYLKRNPFNNEDEAFQQSEIKITETLKSSFIERNINEPRKKIIHRNPDNELQIRLHNDSSFIKFDAEYNGHKIKTWFETGVTDYFVMEKTVADKIGVKQYNYGQDSIRQVNNILMKAIDGIIDSVRLGNVVLHNIPVVVFLEKMTARMPDSLMNKHEVREKIESGFDSLQILLGLSTMQLIGQFEFNWKDNVLSLPKFTNKKNLLPNIYNFNNRLYLQLNITNKNFTGFVDTGGNKSFIELDSSFFIKNQQYLELDKNVSKEPLSYYTATGAYFNVTYEVVKNTEIFLNNKIIPNGSGDIIMLKCTNLVKIFDGFIGVDFFRRLGKKTLFDFDNMVIEME